MQELKSEMERYIMSYEDNLIQIQTRDLKLKKEKKKMTEAQSKMKDVDKAIENALKPNKQSIIDLQAALGLLKLEKERKEAETAELQKEVSRLQAALAGGDAEGKAHVEVQTDIGAEFFADRGRARKGEGNEQSPGD